MNGKKKVVDGLTKYIDNHLGITQAEYSKLVGIPDRTLRDQWKTKNGRTNIENAVFKLANTTFKKDAK